ncbi:MAG: (2Fe-2S)-binding protein [Chloroflexi bacterium]|nr:(2Fe-2S)-binding protein [Chloroflexota bacterium]
MKQPINLKVNGERYDILVDSRQTLLEALRDEMLLYGTKEGCSNGNCGACTVLLDNRPVDSCLVLALEANGHEVTTVEGLAQGGKLHPLQQVFIEWGALQCGFCTPGLLMSAKALLDRNPSPTEHEVRLAIAGNLCRCTGYDKIVRAILAAGQARAEKASESP